LDVRVADEFDHVDPAQPFEDGSDPFGTDSVFSVVGEDFEVGDIRREKTIGDRGDVTHTTR